MWIMVQCREERFIRNVCIFDPVEKFSCCFIVDDVLHKTSHSHNMHGTFCEIYAIWCWRFTIKALHIPSRQIYTINVSICAATVLVNSKLKQTSKEKRNMKLCSTFCSHNYVNFYPNVATGIEKYSCCNNMLSVIRDASVLRQNG